MSRRTRRLQMEPLETRQLLAADLYNFLAPLDVNDDGRTNSLDALQIINRLNARNNANSDASSFEGFLDVNDDGRVSSLDALTVINTLNRRTLADGEVEGDWIRMSGDDATRAAMRLGNTQHGVGLEVRLQGANANQSHAVYLDDNWIGTIELNDRGHGVLQLNPDSSLDGQLPGHLVTGRSSVNLTIDGVGEVELLNSQTSSEQSSESDDSDLSNRPLFFGARLREEGTVRGETLFAQHGERKLLSVYARGLTAEESYSVLVGDVEVANLRANRAGVVLGRIHVSSDEGFPNVERGTSIQIGDYHGEFVPLRDRPQPNPMRDVYIANFRQDRFFGNAQLVLSEQRTVLVLRLARAAADSVHDIFIDDVKIAEARAGRLGFIEFRYDSSRGDSLLAPIPELTDESVLRVGSLATARLIKVSS